MSDLQDSGPLSTGSSTSSSSGGCCVQPVNVQQVKSQLSNRLQGHKSLVLKLHSVLSWDKDYYAGVVFGAVSVFFLVINHFNSSILTTLSYLGIIVTLLDLGAPLISKNLGCCSGKLSDKDNQRFDKILLDLAKIYATMHSLCASTCRIKTNNPKLYYPSLLSSLLIVAFIGNRINNLFLTYLLVLVLALYPGLEKRGITQKIIDQIYITLGRRPPTSGSDRRQSGKKN